ncbi:LOW QUALITY PROTEIN: tektin-1 [Gymnodraco acuticeps]|uniref:Tektin n=1 Tax=Gymnodraco acuticeps TaxID=8218 RepID=A0A6P8T2C3_GYMAC|nr:LOW QUALITY PROTEIN: tektin-1 [Gymnodraco acuticeps]
MSTPDRSIEQCVGPDLENIEVMRNHSVLFRAECKRLIQDTDKACKRMQNDDNRQLDQRVRDIQFLKKELELKLEEIILEIDVLIELQRRVGKALGACGEPLRVTVVCLEERMKRVPPERLHDEVDRELLRERGVIEGVASLLHRVAEQITEQIRLNRSIKYHLEQDLKEKFAAQCIDNSCALMTAHSTNNQQRPKNTQTLLQSFTVTPEQWENISDINMAKAEQQQVNSLSLRAMVESLLEQTLADMQKQFQATTETFQLNVQEIKSAKGLMEDQLAKILFEFASEQRTREDLQVAVSDSEHVLSLAQARLVLRRQRPGKEQCHDPAQNQLLAEVQQLNAHINRLREAASRSEEQQRALVRCQLELQENIERKGSSLYIDEVVCAQHREPIIIHNF